MFADPRGILFTASSQHAVEAFDASVTEFLGAGRDAAVLLGKVESVDPDMVMGQVLRGYFLRLPAQPQLARKSHEALAAAERLSADASPRERQHVAALAAWCRGDIRRANAIWDEILLDHPRDLLALRVAHTMHFYLGDLARMRESMARVMPYWDDSVPGYGYVLGCRAFSLEENHELAEAERLGRRAVEINESDIWAGHCVAHVLEAQERRAEGITWVDTHEAAWAQRGRFANHMWWHRALHHLELEQPERALKAYDREVWPAPSEDNTDIDNASSMLMRLHMLGMDVGNRWHAVAAQCEPYVQERVRPFNDLHYMMALSMSGRTDQAAAMLDSMREFRDTHLGASVDGTEISIAAVHDRVAIPVAEATLAYATGDFHGAARLLEEVRDRLLPVGGSWAQRDVWLRMLIDAATRAGRDRLARGLLAERTDRCPRSAPSWRLYADALERCGEHDAAARARDRADTLRAEQGRTIR